MKTTLAILTLALGALLATGCAQTSCSKCKSCGPCGGGNAPPLGALLGAGGPSGCPNGNCPNHGPLRTAMFGGGGIGGDAGMYGGEPGYLNSWRLGWQRVALLVGDDRRLDDAQAPTVAVAAEPALMQQLVDAGRVTADAASCFAHADADFIVAHSRRS